MSKIKDLEKEIKSLSSDLELYMNIVDDYKAIIKQQEALINNLIKSIEVINYSINATKPIYK